VIRRPAGLVRSRAARGLAWGLVILAVILVGAFFARQGSPSAAAGISPQEATATTPQASGVSAIRFTAGGDVGTTSASDASWQKVADFGGDFHLLLGDLSYSDIEPEDAWCADVISKVGAGVPIQLVSGNHEDDGSDDGHINNFAACLPDRMNSTGIYAAEYYFDVGTEARVIMIAPDLTIDGEDYDYEVGNPHYDWLAAAIDGARAAGVEWIVVGMHKTCITAGNKSCEIGPDLMDLLIDRRVDLVLQGHDHDYQRSKQLTCAEVDVFVASCVADDGADDAYAKGRGTVFVIAGNFGGSGFTGIDRSDPEFAYMAAAMGDGDDPSGRGLLQIEIDSGGLRLEFVGSTTDYSDGFVIGPSATAGTANCSAVPARGVPSEVRAPAAISRGYLKANQRIGSATVRRANGIDRWLNAGILDGDLCGGSLEPADLDSNVTVTSGPLGPTPPRANPRTVAIAPASQRNAAFSATAIQMCINQRIYQTGIARANALKARLAGRLTGGDVVDGTLTRGRLGRDVTITAASAPPSLPAASRTKVTAPARQGCGKVKFTGAQAAVNRRIAIASVVRINETLDQLSAGLTGENFKDGTITKVDFAPGVTP